MMTSKFSCVMLLSVCCIVASAVVMSAPNSVCGLCKQVAADIQSYPDYFQLRKQLIDWCDKIAPNADYKGKCKQAVDMLLLEIAAKNPEQICQDIQLC